MTKHICSANRPSGRSNWRIGLKMVVTWPVDFLPS